MSDPPETPDGSPEASAQATKRFITIAGSDYTILHGLADCDGFPEETARDVLAFAFANLATVADFDAWRQTFRRFAPRQAPDDQGKPTILTNADRLLAVSAVLVMARRPEDDQKAPPG